MWTIAQWYEAARNDASANAPLLHARAKHGINSYLKKLPGMSPEELGERLTKLNRQRLDAVPDLTKYPELRGMRELIDAQWRGLRDGANLDPIEWAVHCDGGFAIHRYIARGLADQMGRCSYVFLPTSDHGPLLANNLDTNPNEPFGPPAWPMINEHLICGQVSSGVWFDEESPEIFPAPVFKLVGRYCRSTDEAIEMLTRFNHFWGPKNLLVVDRGCNTAMVEKSACRIGVRRSSDGFGFIGSMTSQEPAMKAFLADRRANSLAVRKLTDNCSDTAYWRMMDKKYDLMNELMDECRKNPTLEQLRHFIQFRDPTRGNVCVNADVYHEDPTPARGNTTLRTTIWCLREGRAMWWARDAKTGTPVWENRQSDIEYKDVWLWS